jgi:hypothetical protein
MIPLQNIPRASRHCSSYRSLPLGEQQPWGLLLLGLRRPLGKQSSPSLPFARTVFANYMLPDFCISDFYPCTLDSSDPGLLLGLTPATRMGGRRPSFYRIADGCSFTTLTQKSDVLGDQFSHDTRGIHSDEKAR